MNTPDINALVASILTAQAQAQAQQAPAKKIKKNIDYVEEGAGIEAVATLKIDFFTKEGGRSVKARVVNGAVTCSYVWAHGSCRNVDDGAEHHVAFVIPSKTWRKFEEDHKPERLGLLTVRGVIVGYTDHITKEGKTVPGGEAVFSRRSELLLPEGVKDAKKFVGKRVNLAHFGLKADADVEQSMPWPKVTFIEESSGGDAVSL